MRLLLQDPSFAGGFWQGVFQLVSLSIVALFGNFVFQRIRQRYVARQELIDEIDRFTISLYRPRKIYQMYVVHDGMPRDLLGHIASAVDREDRRNQTLHRCLEEIIEVIGRFRSVQVKLVPLYGYNLVLFAHYLAIWRYLKEIRVRMERHESLYFHHETAGSADAFYRLIDAFRYRLSVEPFARHPPELTLLPPAVLETMRAQGALLYDQYFREAVAGADPAGAQPTSSPR